jgi:hypothetical protein
LRNQTIWTLQAMAQGLRAKANLSNCDTNIV